MERRIEVQLLQDNATRLEFANLARQVATNLAAQQNDKTNYIKGACDGLNDWASSLERKAAENAKQPKRAKAKSKVAAKQLPKKTSKKSPKRRKAS